MVRIERRPGQVEQWVEEDRNKFAIYYLAGEAAQRQHSQGTITTQHKTDYSWVNELRIASSAV